MDQPKRLWGARFRASPAPELMSLSRSDSSHFRLVPYDIASSLAHARELVRAGALSEEEGACIAAALTAIDEDVSAGTLRPSETDEDVHTFLERVLVDRLGPVGGKLRAGRSRNDQAANDLKLYLRDVGRRLALDVLALQDALVTQAQRHVETVAPGFTHLQPAQPVTFAHQLLAHSQTFARDVERLRDWDRRAARSPLGAAALAGSAIALRPELSARELGYEAPCENSIDAVGSRDHVAEFLFVAAMLGVHLSRLAEEIFLWSSRQFGWIELDDAYATGSSIMPQKKNADIAELTRGRAARLIGGLAAMLTALKGLPFAYNRDLAEDKRTAFEAVDTLSLVLPAMAGMVRTMRVNVAALKKQSTDGFTLATEVADWLARRGVPFSEAHEITGALVRHCEDRGIGLDDLAEADLAAVDVRLEPAIRSCLTAEAAVAARRGYGGTAPERVREQLARLAGTLEAQREWAAAYDGPRS
ncbi:argininosuccinate lyase [Chelatococcus sp. SYSU_G07232]|uniref:Argininosuccinate lyase n=1 Tax=Chelatococcus albus TaxID=3047466 RepID=A0ABT7AF93_9HYPH|nr:argininosuccinate lyase [Chelatococcus sp. SYSU_G07232]MDJ1158039.1 argininosuccinate lyase [Chelatococcus sp. SYSU_G07232]